MGDALLLELLQEVRALRTVVDALTEEQRHVNRRALAADDRRELTRLLPLVHALLGDQAWSAASLYRLALASDCARELAEQLEGWNTESGGLRTFGWLLERCAGRTFAGFRLVALVGAKDRGGELYQVMRVSAA